jgi:ComF family protein
MDILDRPRKSDAGFFVLSVSGWSYAMRSLLLNGLREVGASARATLRTAGDLLVPPACISCRAPLATDQDVCARCWREIHFIRPPLCDVLGIPLPFDPGGRAVSARAEAEPPDYDRARAAAEHTGTMRRLIAAFKYADRLEARQVFGRWMQLAGAELLAEADVILPVPLHRLRLWQRQYNQSAILAKELGRLTGLPVRYGLLVRTKRTPQQVTLTPAERLRNPRGAFRVPTRKRTQIDGRRVLLIDDVQTTGATVNACARCLKAAGATGVDVLTLTVSTGRPDDGMIA